MSGVDATDMNQPADTTRSVAAASAPRRSWRRRWARKLGISIAAICLLIALGLWMVTRSWFIIWQLKPVLERKLGGEVTIANAAYEGGGRVTFQGIALRAEDLRGPAAEILRIQQAQVVVDLSNLLAGSIRVDDARLSGVTVRISEDLTRTSQMNFMALHPRGGGRGRTRPPARVSIDGLTLEVGVHLDDQFILNGRRSLAGEMYPAEGQEEVFKYRLVEVDDKGVALEEAGLVITGQWNALSTRAEAHIEAITLDDRVLMMLPRQARWWWNRMQLVGRVDGVGVEWSPQTPLTVRFGVRDLAMTMPVDIGEVWSVYRNGAIEPTTSRPRMYVHGGDIRVATDSLELDRLRGELVTVEPVGLSASAASSATPPMVGVPYEITLRVPKLPPIDWQAPERWMEDALTTAPFELQARMENFSLSKIAGGETQAVGLPSIVAKVLAKFQATNWVLSTDVSVSRGEPTPDDGGIKHAAPLMVSGNAFINDATGSYHKFPYQLEDVDAYLRFTDERVDVEYLDGRGSEGSKFHLTGFIEPPDKDARFHIEVKGTSVPLDDRLRGAFKPKEMQAFDALFNRQSAECMARGGVLPDATMLAAQRAEREAAAAQLALLRQNPDAERSTIAGLEKSIESLDRSIAAGPFVVGGMGDIELTLERPLGPQKDTSINGYITIASASMIFDRFPYPLRGSGRLKWEPDRVSIDTSQDPAGMRFITPAGGVGHVSGSVAFPKSETGGRNIRPDLEFVIDDDPVNDAVFAAIPYSKAELERTPELEFDWPGPILSRSGRIVRGIGLAGNYDYRGRIATRDDGKMDWDFFVTLDGGTAEPNALLSDAINARDLPWPNGLVLANLKGGVRVRREGVTWENVTGQSDQTRVASSGTIDFRTREGEQAGDSVSVKLENAPVDRSALNMISRASAKTAEDLWDRYQPMGRIDGEILWRSDAPPGEAGTFIFTPRNVNMLVGGERVTLSPPTNVDGGKVRIDGNLVRFENIALQLASLAAPDTGRLMLDGQWTFSGPTPNFSIAGEWKGGKLESPVIPEALRIFGQVEQARRFTDFDPTGEINLGYEIARAAPDAPPQYRFSIDPRHVEFTLRDTRVTTDIASGQASITPGLITLDRITGQAASGDFSVDGQIVTSGPLDVTLQLNYTGRLASEEVAAFLPTAVNDSLTALEFDDASATGSTAGVSRVTNGRLHVRQTGAEPEPRWQTEFTGLIEVDGASFVAGVEFSEVQGSLDLDVSHEVGRPMMLNAVGRASRAIVFGQELQDIEAPMALNPEGDALEIPAAHARSGEGEVACSAVSGIGLRRDYRTRIDLIGVPLGNMLRRPAAPPGHFASDGPESAVRGVTELVRPQEPPAGTQRDHATLSGQVYSSLTLAGDRGDATGKRGRGIFRVINGRLSTVPLVLQALQVMQLTLPIAGELDYADADMYVIGDMAHFEHILFESSVGGAAALQLRGEGTLDLRTMEIAARFRARSGVAILRDIIGGIGDMLYEIEVTGPLREPRARIVPLP